MAIIYSYPTKPTPALTDLVLITDSESTNPKNQTKNATLQSIADLIDGEVTLQEVLDAGNTANNQSITLTGAPGSLSISGFATIGTTLQVTTSAEIANVVYSSSNILSNADLTIANTTGILNLNGPNNIALTSSNASIVLTSGGLAGDDIDLNAGSGDVDVDCATFEVTSKGTSMDATVGTTSIIGDGAISIGDTNTSAINLRSEAGVSITAPTPATADVDSTVVFRGPNGAVDRPTYSFANGNTTGIYMATPDEISVGIAAAEKARIVADTIQFGQGVTFANSALGSPQVYQKVNNFENGTWTPVIVDGITPVPGLTYVTQEGTYMIINNIIYGTFKIVATNPGPPIPIANFGIIGNILSGTGAGTNLFAQFPVNNATGSTVTIGNTGVFNTATGYPVGGFVSATAAQGLALQTFVSGTEYRKVSANPELGASTNIEGSFIYNYLP